MQKLKHQSMLLSTFKYCYYYYYQIYFSYYMEYYIISMSIKAQTFLKYLNYKFKFYMFVYFTYSYHIELVIQICTNI
jgi:hypothetical protein